DASPNGVPVPPGSDRCLKEACRTTTLPEQPDYPVLGDAGDGWLRLIEADWQLAAGSEGYRCARVTLPRDVLVHAFSALSPYGTHHTVLMVETQPSEPDGVTVCNVGATGERRLQGAGAGSGSTATLPAGVAMKIAKGQQC
ncbi:MAG TPA: hypothetical protein VJR89_40235, partial [Polyangiales bacterium]|nr:hypothetical protein [Polyangiales bacterium]